MAWRAVARSATGTSHQKQQLPCQDYGGCKILNEVIVGAVADGAGSAKYADVGAKLAVKTVLEYLTGIEQWLQKRKKFWELTQKPLSEPEARKLFAKTANKVMAALQAQAVSGGYSVDDLASTLLVVVATPNWVTAMQIGDGFITLRCQQEELQLLFPPDKGEYVNETTFVTSTNALNAMRVCVREGKPEFICAATDGLERVAIRMSDWTPFAPFFQPLEEYMHETSHPEQSDEYLMSFLSSDRLNARTDDDKTLLLCCYDDSLDSR
jgi:serine/threonine protein phosphatase PrpC